MCGALRDLVTFVQFKKRENHPWRSVNFSKVAGFMLSCWDDVDVFVNNVPHKIKKEVFLSALSVGF